MKRWYVIKTKPRKEKDVLHQLARACHDLFLPQIRGMTGPKALFPSYLFIRTNFDDPFHHRLVRFTRGVNKILGNSDGPQSVPDIIIETLKERTRDGSLIEQDLLFKKGDEVRVKRGILKDLCGVIERNLSERGRVKILFKWLHNNLQAFVRYTDLEKVA